MTRKAPAAHRDAQILAVLTAHGPCRVPDVARCIGLSESAIATKLHILERQGAVDVRVETLAEARARVDAMPVRAFVRRQTRRQLLYTIARPGDTPCQP